MILCSCVLNLTLPSAVWAKVYLLDAGAIGTAIEVMKAHAMDPLVLEDALGVIRNCSANGGPADGVAATGCIVTVLDIVRKHAHNGPLLQVAFAAISNTCKSGMGKRVA